MQRDYTNDNVVRLNVDLSRRASVGGTELAEVHRRIGTLLSRDVAATLTLETVSIEHPTGITDGVRVTSTSQPVIIALLRSGLFLAEGLWQAIPGATLTPVRHIEDLDVASFEGRPLVIVDAVINTGRSLRTFIGGLVQAGGKVRHVVALVGYRPTLEQLVEEYPEFQFTVARVSERSYVGKGRTDTGERLFSSGGSRG